MRASPPGECVLIESSPQTATAVPLPHSRTRDRARFVLARCTSDNPGYILDKMPSAQLTRSERSRTTWWKSRETDQFRQDC